MRAEDTDVLVMLVHHRANHPVFLTTAKDTSYDVGKIREALPERYRHTLYSYIASLGVIPYQQFLGLANQLCSASSERAMDVFSITYFFVEGGVESKGIALKRLYLYKVFSVW